MRRRLTSFIAIVALYALTGCQVLGGFEDTTQGEDPGGGEPGFSFAVITPQVAVPLDGMNTVQVQVQRTGGFEGAVTVAAVAAPNGLIVQELTIPPGAAGGDLVVGARAPFAIGGTLSFDLVATGDGVPDRTVTVDDAEITGRPGLLDVTFGPDATGYGTLSFGGDDGGEFTSFEITPDDRILAVGFGVGGLGGLHFHIGRLTGDGLRDTTFNNGQVVNTPFANSTADEAQAFAVGRQVDGRIIAIGWRQRLSGEPPDVALAQYSSSGGPGSQLFGNHDIAQSLLNAGGDEIVFDGAVLPDNKILAAGQSDNRLMVARADSQGFPDTSFGTGGFALRAVGAQAVARAMVIDSEGRIVVAGFTSDADAPRDVLLVRFTKDGQVDTSFGRDGEVIAGSDSADEIAVALTLLPDGSILTAGDSSANGDRDFEVRRFTPAGLPDPSFGEGGVVTVPITPGQADAAADMAVLPDGRVVVIGNTAVAPNRSEPVVARYTRDGALDPFFGDGGVLPVFVGDDGVIRAIRVSESHKVVISGANLGGVPGPGTFGVLLRMWM